MNENNKPQNVKCPDCDGEMVPRTSTYGKFWGCKAYPKCKGTRDANGDSKADRAAKQRLAEGDENIEPDSSKESNRIMTTFNRRDKL